MTANQSKIRTWNIAWHHGYDDCKRGQHVNPYMPVGSYLHQAWAEGHYRQELDEEPAQGSQS